MATAKKKAAPKKVAAVKKVDSPDIVISVSITTIDGTVTQRDLMIQNASGCISKAYLNDSGQILDVLFSGLVAKYGSNHARG